MEKRVASYKVIISPDKQTGTGRGGFTAYVPKLGISDDGFTIEEALHNVKELAKFHLEALAEEGESIPTPDSEQSFVTSARFEVNVKKNVSEFEPVYA